MVNIATNSLYHCDNVWPCRLSGNTLAIPIYKTLWVNSGAGSWLAELIIGKLPVLSESPLIVAAVLLMAAIPVRLLIPNITGFLAVCIPIAISIANLTGLNPLICSLLVMIVGDSVLYYPAQSASSLVVYERGYLSSAEIFWFGCLMTIIACLV